MSFQTHKTLVQLRNINLDIFDEIRDLHGQQHNYHVQGPGQ